MYRRRRLNYNIVGEKMVTLILFSNVDPRGVGRVLGVG